MRLSLILAKPPGLAWEGVFPFLLFASAPCFLSCLKAMIFGLPDFSDHLTLSPSVIRHYFTHPLLQVMVKSDRILGICQPHAQTPLVEAFQ
jgi:hypothetical protein